MRIVGTLVAFLMLGTLGACAPEIGDECSTSQDCGSGRLCDSSQPGGYCTATPCDSTATCPDGSVCVKFPNTETFCMLHCEGNGDCRDGYVCVTGYGEAPFCNAAAQP